MKLFKVLPVIAIAALCATGGIASATPRTSPLAEKCGGYVNLILFGFYASDKKCDDRQDAIVLRNHLGKNAAAVNLLCRDRVEAWTMERNHLSCRPGTNDSTRRFGLRLRIHLAIEQERREAFNHK